ncbi:hypothetical protein B0H14DRAFT_3701866 [Mycena olivaceomarginata]|nr:hypothetical protein B0H14DRAFT_3701866 [Mycena olivaceomarginata]
MILTSAVQSGVFISHVLFGVTTAQTYIYYSRFPDDSRKIKALVAFIWVCEITHAVCIGHTIYTYTISNYGLPERLSGAFPKSFLAAVFLTGAIAALVQGFFTFRVYAISKRFCMSLMISVMIVLRLLNTSAISFIGMTMTMISFEKQWGWMVILSSSITSAIDFTITTILVVFPPQPTSQRTQEVVPAMPDVQLLMSHRTTALVDKIIVWTIETGLLTRSLPPTLVHEWILQLSGLGSLLSPRGLGKLGCSVSQNYTVMQASSINSRATLRAVDQETVTLPSLLPAMTKVTQVVYDAEARRSSCDDEAAKAV